MAAQTFVDSCLRRQLEIYQAAVPLQLDAIVVNGFQLSHRAGSSGHLPLYIDLNCSSQDRCWVGDHVAVVQITCQISRDTCDPSVLQIQVSEITHGVNAVLVRDGVLNHIGLGRKYTPERLIVGNCLHLPWCSNPVEVSEKMEDRLRYEIGCLIDLRRMIRKRLLLQDCLIGSWTSQGAFRIGPRAGQLQLPNSGAIEPTSVSPASSCISVCLPSVEDMRTLSDLFRCAMVWPKIYEQALEKTYPNSDTPGMGVGNCKRLVSSGGEFSTVSSTDHVEQGKSSEQHYQCVFRAKERRTAREFERGSRLARHLEDRRNRERERETERLNRLLRRAAELDVSRCCNDVRTLLVAREHCEEAGIFVPVPPTVCGQVTRFSFKLNCSVAEDAKAHPMPLPTSSWAFFAWRVERRYSAISMFHCMACVVDSLHLLSLRFKLDLVRLPTIAEITSALLIASDKQEALHHKALPRGTARRLLHLISISLIKPWLSSFSFLELDAVFGETDLVNDLTWPTFARFAFITDFMQECGFSNSEIVAELRGAGGWMMHPPPDSPDYFTLALLRSRSVQTPKDGKVLPIPDDTTHPIRKPVLAASRQTMRGRLPVPCSLSCSASHWQSHLRRLQRVKGEVTSYQVDLTSSAELSNSSPVHMNSRLLHLRRLVLHGFVTSCELALRLNSDVAASLGAIRNCLRTSARVTDASGIVLALTESLNNIEVLHRTYSPNLRMGKVDDVLVQISSSDSYKPPASNCAAIVEMVSSHVRLRKVNLHIERKFVLKTGVSQSPHFRRKCLALLQELQGHPAAAMVPDLFGKLQMIYERTLKSVEGTSVSFSCYHTFVQNVRLMLSKAMSFHGECASALEALKKLGAVFERLARQSRFTTPGADIGTNSSAAGTDYYECCGLASSVSKNRAICCSRCDATYHICCIHPAVTERGYPWFCHSCTQYAQGPGVFDGVLAEHFQFDGAMLMVTQLHLQCAVRKRSAALVSKTGQFISMSVDSFICRLYAPRERSDGTASSSAGWTFPVHSETMLNKVAAALPYDSTSEVACLNRRAITVLSNESVWSQQQWSDVLLGLAALACKAEVNSMLLDGVTVSCKHARQHHDYSGELGTRALSEGPQESPFPQFVSSFGLSDADDVISMHSLAAQRKQRDVYMIESVIKSTSLIVNNASNQQVCHSTPSAVEASDFAYMERNVVGLPNSDTLLCNEATERHTLPDASWTKSVNLKDEDCHRALPHSCSLCGGDSDYLISPFVGWEKLHLDYTWILGHPAKSRKGASKVGIKCGNDNPLSRGTQQHVPFAHEFCADVIHGVRTNLMHRVQQRSAALINERLRLKGCGRTVPLGSDQRGRLFWNFLGEPSVLYVQESESRNRRAPVQLGAVDTLKASSAVVASNWSCYYTAPEIARVIFCLRLMQGSTTLSVDQAIAHAYPEASVLATQHHQQYPCSLKVKSSYATFTWLQLENVPCIQSEFMSRASHTLKVLPSGQHIKPIFVRGGRLIWSGAMCGIRKRQGIAHFLVRYTSWATQFDEYIGYERLLIDSDVARKTCSSLHHPEMKLVPFNTLVSVDCLVLKASNFVGSPGRIHPFNRPGWADAALVHAAKGRCTIGSKFEALREGILTVDAALPRGSLKSVGGPSLTLLVHYKRVTCASSVVELSEAVVVLEDSIVSSWLNPCWGVVRNSLPSRTTVLKNVSLSLVATLLTLLDSCLLYDKVVEHDD